MKIFVPDGPAGGSEFANIVHAGIQRHPDVQLCDDMEDADLIIFMPHHVTSGQRVRYPDKTVIVDYTDTPRSLVDDNALVYFKRSVVLKRHLKRAIYEREVIPIAYCVRNEAIDLCRDPSAHQRDIDVACLFEPGMTTRRGRVASAVHTGLSHYETSVGVVGRRGPEGRRTFQHAYFETMLRSKIVITCNPDRWEGDYRLFEALSCGALVLVDSMLTPIKHPFVNKKHLVYYADERDVVEKAAYYLRNPAERKRIADAGHRFALEHHTARHRIDEIIEEFNIRVAEGTWARCVRRARQKVNSPRRVLTSLRRRFRKLAG